MGKIESKYIVTMVLLLVTAVFIALSPHPWSGTEQEVNLKFFEFPKQIGSWKGGEDIIQDEKSYKILGTRNVLMREYTNPGSETVTLLMVYSEANRTSFHPPEICLPAARWVSTKKTVTNLAVTGSASYNLAANTYQMKAGENGLLMLYWFMAGKRFTNNYYKQQMYLIADGLKGRKTFGAMVRVTVPHKLGQSERAMVLANDFIQHVVPLIPRYLSR
jgi:EpsI family protein